MLTDILDMAKVSTAGVVGVGSWYTELSQVIQILISITCLVFIVGKTYYMFINKGK